MSHRSLCPRVLPSLPRRSLKVCLPLTSPEMSAFPRSNTESASASPFSGPARRSLRVAARVVADHPEGGLYTEGSDRFVTSTTAPIATGRRGSCRVGLSPTEKALVFTAHSDQG